MKNLHIFFALTFLISSYSFAQAPLTLDQMENSIGTEFTLNGMQSGDAGTAGNNQTWDFTFLIPEGVQNAVIAEYGSTNLEDEYPDANTVVSIGPDLAYEFRLATENEYSTYGQYEFGGFQSFYSNPQTLFVFPAELGVAYVDSFAFDYITVNDQEASMLGEIDMEINGYGDIIMPWGTVEGAYRTSGTISRVESFEFQGDTIQAFLEGTDTYFAAPGYPMPVISVIQGIVTVPTLDIVQNIQSTTFISNFDFVGTDDVVVDELNVFPNPASDQLNINFEKRDSDAVQIDLLDIRGRVVQSAGRQGGGFGRFQTQLDVSALPAGFYLLRLATQSGTQTIKVAVD
ncbi:MAG: T9SS type A sorting domain-containing protein [Flavobacteriales bacterium]|nr:T9SS type A sorting domain-containing protein [Flavobacteriales bacterium]